MSTQPRSTHSWWSRRTATGSVPPTSALSTTTNFWTSALHGCPTSAYRGIWKCSTSYRRTSSDESARTCYERGVWAKTFGIARITATYSVARTGDTHGDDLSAGVRARRGGRAGGNPEPERPAQPVV